MEINILKIFACGKEYVERQVPKSPRSMPKSDPPPNYIISADNTLIDYNTYQSISKKNPLSRTIGDTFSSSYGSLSTGKGSGKRAIPGEGSLKINPLYYEPEKEKNVSLNLKWRSAPKAKSCVVNTTIGFDTTECDEMTILEDYNNQGNHDLHEWMMNRDSSEIVVTDKGPDVGQVKCSDRYYELPEYLRAALATSGSSERVVSENTFPHFELPDDLDGNLEDMFMLESGTITPKYIETPPK